MAMVERDLDLEIMLTVVQYVSKRGASPSGQAANLSDLLQALPEGATIGTVIGAIYNQGDLSMNDSYKTGQAGAVGPGSSATGNTFTQHWLENGSQIDLAVLRDELQTLRDAARSQSSGIAEQDVALGQLAQAQQAADSGDGAAAMQFLSKAGDWVLGVARGIGVPIAIKAIEGAMGL